MFFILGAYFHKDLKTVDDVYGQILLLGDDYVPYAKTFKEENVDGYWFLNQIDHEKLIKYGVKIEDHRQAILDSIEQLKKEYPNQLVTEKK
jgi:hypothetical protein